MKKIIVNIKMEKSEKELAKKDAHKHEMNLSEYIRWLIEKERLDG